MTEQKNKCWSKKKEKRFSFVFLVKFMVPNDILGSFFHLSKMTHCGKGVEVGDKKKFFGIKRNQTKALFSSWLLQQ